MRILCFLGFCSVLSPGLLGQKKGLTVVHQWSTLEYAFPTAADRQQAIDTQVFVPGNGIPIDVDVDYQANGKSRVFVTVPRFQDGIPATLNTVSKQVMNGNPVLQPYPAWNWHQNSAACNADRLVSVFRVQIDECNRLWVLDSGKIGGTQHCPPQIIAFDLTNDRVLHRFAIPLTQIKSTSILVTPVVDVRDTSTCANTFVYMADVTGFGLIVYDLQRQTSWRITNKLFYPIPDFGTFNIVGESFDLMDGILGMTLSPYNGPAGDRVLYFHALASNTENYVYTSIIRNDTIFRDNDEAAPREFKVFTKKRPSQSAAEAMDRNGIMYFGLTRETSINCWNSNTDYDQRNFDALETNVETLQFPSGMKVVTNRKGSQELWVLTCRFQKVMTGSIDQQNEINFRIQAVKVDDFIQDSKCKNLGGRGASGANYGRPSYSSYMLAPEREAIWSRIGTDGINNQPKREAPSYIYDDAIIFRD